MSSAAQSNTSGFMISKKRMLWVKSDLLGGFLEAQWPVKVHICWQRTVQRTGEAEWGSVSRLDHTLLQFRPDPMNCEISRHSRHRRTFQISSMCFVFLHSFKYKFTLVRPSGIFPKPDRVVNRLQETSHEAVLCTRSSGQTGLFLLFRSTSLHDWTVTERN